MDQLYLFSGPLCSLRIEKASFKRFGPFWREGQKELFEKREWDEAGRIGLIEKPNYFEHWAYLPDKRKAACYRFDRKDELIYKDVYFYGEREELEYREIFEKRKADRKILYREEQGILIEQEGDRIKGYGYNKKGQLVSEYLYHGNETDLITKYIYGEAGLIRKEEKDKTGHIISSTDYTRNDSSLLLEEIQKNGSGQIIFHKMFNYPRGEDANWLVREEYALNRRGKKIPLSLYYRSLNFYHSPHFKDKKNGTTGKLDREEKKTNISPAPSHEKVGTIPFANGFYKGELRDNIMEGQGVFTFNDGRIYKGNFHQGRIEGKGQLKGIDGSLYQGNFLQGKMHGKGVMIWKDGSKYEGPFTGGLMNGVGIFTWPNGDRFKGLFEKGKRTDQGLIEPAD
jgi:hypothetical protein